MAILPNHISPLPISLIVALCHAEAASQPLKTVVVQCTHMLGVRSGNKQRLNNGYSLCRGQTV